MGESIIQRSFAAGELAPALHARADQAKYQTGLRTCRNFFVRREGGASNRAGFRFVNACKTDDFGARLMRYVGSTDSETYLIEMGEAYFRFYQDGALVLVESADAYNGATAYEVGDIVEDGGAFFYAVDESTGVATSDTDFWYPLPMLGAAGILEVPTDYTLGTLPDWNQSGNVITLTNPFRPARELIFLGEVRWVLRDVSTVPTIPAPSGLNFVAGGAGSRVFKFKVTAAALDTYEESDASAIFTVNAAADPTIAAPVVGSWTAQPAAGEFYVYVDPYENGVYGYIGTAATNAFKWSGQIPDFNLTPPISRALFVTANNAPSHSANYQQRRFFAHTHDEPDSIWGSRIGFPSNFGISSPLQDDDSVTFRLAGNNHHAVRFMLALKAGLIVFTDGGEWTVTGGDGPKSPITPSSIAADQETYVGIAQAVRPVVVGNAAIYIQARGTVPRELRFDQEAEGLAGRDLGIFATHLFERQTIRAVDYQQTPHSIVWCVRSDGSLLGLTYIPEQDIWGWHRHTTAGTSSGQFEDVCVVPESDEDVLYVIVRRVIDGATKRYIERLERRDLLDGFIHATSFFVDSGLSYSDETPADTFAGLDHLEGERVAVYADGLVLYDGYDTESPIVSGGTVTLDEEYHNVHIGLPIFAELETLDLDVQGLDIRDKQKRIQSVSLLLERSARMFHAGPDADHLTRYRVQPWEDDADINTDQLEITLPSTFQKNGRVLIRSTDPLPLTILGIIPHAEMGG